MKHHPLVVSLAASAALAGHGFSRTSSPTLSFNDAVEIARQEMERRGLTITHEASAFYAGVDKQTEGAAFAMIIRPRRDASGRGMGGRLKLLIQNDGRTTLLPVAKAPRNARPDGGSREGAMTRS